MIKENVNTRKSVNQIKSVLSNYLPVERFLVEKIVDPDDGSENLLVVALTQMAIDKAMVALDRFYESWWIDNYNPDICVDVMTIK